MNFIKKSILWSLFIFFSYNAIAINTPPKDSVGVHHKTKVSTKTTIKTIETILGRKMTFSEKVVAFLYKHNIIKVKKNDRDKTEEEAIKKGRKSLNLSIIGWGCLLLSAVVPFLGLVALPLFIISLVNGIQSLNLKKKGNTNAVLGIVFSSLYLFIFILAIILVIAVLSIR